MMSRILVAAGVLYGAHSAAVVGDAATQKKDQQHQQSQKDTKKYIDEYVPAEYRKYALHSDAEDRHKKDSTATQTQVGTGVNLLAMPDASEKQSGQSSGGDYQQYIKKYAGGRSGGSQSGDYEQYMKKYAGGSQGGSQSGNYQQYMKKYAGGSHGGSQSGDYQQYMKKYAGGSQGGSQSGDYQQYMKKYAGGSQGGSQSGDYQQYMKKYAGGSQGGSQSGDYQQYMKKYAGGSQGAHKVSSDDVNLLAISGSSSHATSSDAQSSGNYEQYMKQYAGGTGGSQGGNYKQYYDKYMNKYAGQGDYEKYSDYQKYIQRYNNEEHNNVVRSAQDAQTVSQLDAWRDQSKQNVQWYVPSQYSTYANKDVDRRYNQRLSELQHGATDKTAISAEDLDTSIKSPLDSLKSPFVLNLDAVPAHLRKADEVAHLKEAAEAEVKRAENLGSSLRDAATDRNAIEAVAARPARHVEAAYTERAKAVESEIANLQNLVKSKTTGADFEKKVHQCHQKVAQLRSDEFRALDQAHRDADDAAGHAARGSQSEVRHEARQVWAISDRMSDKNESYQDVANQLQNRVEKAADNVESNSEELARRTQDHLQNNLDKAREVVHKETARRMETLREVRDQFHELEAAQKTAGNAFLAQLNGIDTTHAVAPVMFTALASVALAFLAFLVKRSTRSATMGEEYHLQA